MQLDKYIYIHVYVYTLEYVNLHVSLNPNTLTLFHSHNIVVLGDREFAMEPPTTCWEKWN